MWLCSRYMLQHCEANTKTKMTSGWAVEKVNDNSRILSSRIPPLHRTDLGSVRDVDSMVGCDFYLDSSNDTRSGSVHYLRFTINVVFSSNNILDPAFNWRTYSGLSGLTVLKLKSCVFIYISSSSLKHEVNQEGARLHTLSRFTKGES